MKIKWNITLHQKDVGELKNVAVFASANVVATDGDKNASVDYNINLLPADPKTFTSIDSATDEQIEQWVKDAFNAPGKIGVAAVEAELVAKMADYEPETTVVVRPAAAE